VLDFDGCCSYEGLGLNGLCQAADFADHVASGALTVDFAAEVESLRVQHVDAVREKSAAKAKTACCRRRLLPWRPRGRISSASWQRRGGRPTRPSLMRRSRKLRPKWHGLRAVSPANGPRSWSRGSNALPNRVDKAETSTRAEVERTHAERELGLHLFPN
jgi:hypothetical protein